jgi:hypothetical protein
VSCQSPLSGAIVSRRAVRAIGVGAQSAFGFSAHRMRELADGSRARARDGLVMRATSGTRRDRLDSPPIQGTARNVVIVLAALNGIGAVLGGMGLLRDAHGMGYETSWLRGPLSDYTVPGLFLLIVIGGGMLVTTGLAFAHRPTASAAACGVGGVLLAWLVIETLVIGYRGPIQIVFLVACGASGATLAWIGAHGLRDRTPVRRATRS